MYLVLDAFAEVKGNPEVEDESNEVKLTFTIEPEKEHIRGRSYLPAMKSLKTMS